MSAPPVAAAYYADFSGMEALKKAAQQNQPAAVREAARQFESLFTNMLLKSMREASMGESLGDSEQTQFYQGMFDQQLSLQLSHGRGLGLADHLLQQLQRTGIEASPPTAKNLSTREQFIQTIQPYAVEAARRLGVAPEAIIAHAALETGWGQHLSATAAGSSHNLFGVKADGSWRGAVAESGTTEYVGSTSTHLRAGFRAYDSLGASMRDYTGLIGGSPRFAGALNTGSDIAAFAKGLQRGGYATDPAYVQKLVATAAAVRESGSSARFKIANALPIVGSGETA